MSEPRGIQLIAAADASAFDYWHRSGYSEFTRAFLQALRRDPSGTGGEYVTASEIGLFVRSEVTKTTRGLQVPRWGWLTSDSGDMVFRIPTEPRENPFHRIRNQREGLRVGMDKGDGGEGTPPMYFPRDGRDDGFDVVTAREVANGIGVSQITLVNAPYQSSGNEAGLLAILRAGQVDAVISGFQQTPVEGVEWSLPYLESTLCLVVRSNGSVRRLADLRSTTVGTFADPAASAAVRKLLDRSVKVQDDLQRGYWQRLAEGELGAFVYDCPFAVAELKKEYRRETLRPPGVLCIADAKLAAVAYRVAVRAEDQDLIPTIDKTIRDWMATPRYEEARRTYLENAEELRCNP